MDQATQEELQMALQRITAELEQMRCKLIARGIPVEVIAVYSDDGPAACYSIEVAGSMSAIGDRTIATTTTSLEALFFDGDTNSA